MAWFKCMGGNGGGSGTVFRYFKWHISKLRNSDGYIQMSDIQFQDETDNRYPFNSSASCTFDGNSGTNLIDGSANSKVALVWNPSSGSDVIIDVGQGGLDISTYKKFAWYTANDANGRDPVSWELYGSNDSSFINAYLLNQEDDAEITTTRKVLAYTGNLIIH